MPRSPDGVTRPDDLDPDVLAATQERSCGDRTLPRGTTMIARANGTHLRTRLYLAVPLERVLGDPG